MPKNQARAEALHTERQAPPSTQCTVYTTTARTLNLACDFVESPLYIFGSTRCELHKIGGFVVQKSFPNPLCSELLQAARIAKVVNKSQTSKVTGCFAVTKV